MQKRIKSTIVLLLIVLPAGVFAAESLPAIYSDPDTRAVIETQYGNIVLRFFPDSAPAHVKNFLALAEKGFYDGTAFHRIAPGFVIQGGDPNSRRGGDPSLLGKGGPGYTIRAELSDRLHRRGTLSMAHGKELDSAGSQFFICLADAPSLNKKYTIFGEVVSGMDVADRISREKADKSGFPENRIDMEVEIYTGADPSLMNRSHLLSGQFKELSAGRRYAEAARVGEEIRGIRGRALGPGHPYTLKITGPVALLYFQAGDSIKGLALLDEVLAGYKKGSGTDQRNARSVLQSGLQAIERLSGEYRDRKDYAALKKMLQRELEINMSLYGVENWRTKRARWEIEDTTQRERLTDRDAKRLAEADAVTADGDRSGKKDWSRNSVKSLESALRTYEDLMGKGTVNCGYTLYLMGQAERALGEYRSACDHYLASAEIYRKQLGSDHPRFALGLESAARTSIILKDPEGAKELLMKALEVREKGAGKHSAYYALALYNLGFFHEQMKDYEKSIDCLRRSADLYKNIQGADSRSAKQVNDKLAGVLIRQIDALAARADFKEAAGLKKEYQRIPKGAAEPWAAASDEWELKYLEQAAGLSLPDRKRLVEAGRLAREAYELADKGRDREALGRLSEAVRITGTLLGVKSLTYAERLNQLGSIYLRLEEYALAAPAYKKALDIARDLPDYARYYGALFQTNHAEALFRQGNFREAEKGFRKAVEMTASLYGTKHDQYQYSAGRLADTLARLAFSQAQNGGYKEALVLRREEARIRKSIREEDPKVRDALAEAEYLDRMARLTPAQVKEIARAEQLKREALTFRQEKQYRKALASLERAGLIQENQLGRMNRAYVDTLLEISITQNQAGEFAQALSVLQQRLEIVKSIYGEKNHHTGIALVEIAMARENGGDYAGAAASMLQSAEVMRRIYGPAHTETLNAAFMALEKMELHGDRLLRSGDWGEARKVCADMLKEGTRAFGKDFWQARIAGGKIAYLDTVMNLAPARQGRLREAQRLSDRADELDKKKKPAEALAAIKEAMGIQKEIAGEDNFVYLEMLARQNDFLMNAGNLGEADKGIDLYIAAQERLHGKVQPFYAVGLYKKSFVAAGRKDLVRAEESNREAWVILERLAKTAKMKHASWYYSLLLSQADSYESTGRYEKAVPGYLEIIEIALHTYGRNSARYAEAVYRLGRAHYNAGQYAAARQYLDEALRVRRPNPDADRTGLLSALNYLGLTYVSMNELKRSEELFTEAIAVMERAGDTDAPFYATLLGNLSHVCSRKGEPVRAESLLNTALATMKRALGEDHLWTASLLNKLADLYLERGDPSKAEPFLRRGMAVLEKSSARYDRITRTYLQMSLAEIELARGRVDEALNLCLEIQETRKSLLGKDHPAYGLGLANLANVYRQKGDDIRAEALLKEALDLNLKFMQEAASGQTEREQLSTAGNYRDTLFAFLSAMTGRTGADEAYGRVLPWKGAVFARQVRIRTVRSRPEFATLASELQETAARLSVLSGRRDEEAADEIDRLTRRKDQLEGEMARLTSKFELETAAARRTPEEIKAILPAGAALVDFLEYRHLSRPAAGKTALSAEQRIAAFVLKQGAPVSMVDLGPVRPIADAVEAWRMRFGTPPRKAGQAGPDPGQALRRLVWDPIESSIGSAGLVLISPDGILTRVPFPALPGKKSSYLLEEKRIALIAVPRLLPDLLRSDQKKEGEKKPSLMLIGDVDFDAAPGTITTARGEASAMKRPAVQAPPPGSAGPTAERMARLPGTVREIRLIQESFGKAFADAPVSILRGSNATERAVRNESTGQRYIHLATHGFFAPERLSSALAGPGGGERSVIIKEKAPSGEGMAGLSGYHPGLLSGIALAGANRGVQAINESGRLPDDGILKALEVAEMNLTDTELVVLSACETGLGQLAGGEGVLGLQRAFQVSGARSVVSTLWSVDDEATQALMVEFYRNLWEKKMEKLEALRQAQISIMKGSRRITSERSVNVISKRAEVPGRSAAADAVSPFFWAAFVLSGDWR